MDHVAGGGADDRAVELRKLFLAEADVGGIAELDLEGLLAHVAVLLDVVGGVPQPFPQREGLIQGDLRIHGLAVVVLIPVPDLVAHGFDGVPGKPEIEHLHGGSGEFRQVGQNGAAVGEIAVAQLNGHVAGFEQVIQMKRALYFWEIHGVLGLGVFCRIRFDHIPHEILVKRSVSFFFRDRYHSVCSFPVG